MDTRHENRQKIVQELYALSFSNTKDQITSEKTKQILEKKGKINELIHEFAPKFPIEKIAKIDLAILQLSIFDLQVEKHEPPKVIINEAVELAKELGSDRSYAFINAVLGKIYEKINQK